MSGKGPVIVMEVPEQLTRAEVTAFLDELRPFLDTDRPSIVLDCSQVRDLDGPGIEMLLHCLQETMKRNGDLKLAAVSPASTVILEVMRADRLFEIFGTSQEAVRSFHASAASANVTTQPWYSAGYGVADLKTAG